ncbi:MAG: DUF507 family protein [Myxococcota bacterium]|nr:DUF507 family protein [Myxococcota bacterium]MDW8362647.1 DUF507 family protein [Myxococcales bacterium]
MRLYAGKVTTIAEEIVRELSASQAIELENADEARLDVEAVLREYLRRDRELFEEARARLEQRGMGHSGIGRMRAQLARERGLPPPEEALPYLVDQILEMLFHSRNVAEVFADDVTLRKQITPVLRRHMDVDGEVDREVRARIRNLEEGTAAFEIEYGKVLEQIRRKRGLS